MFHNDGYALFIGVNDYSAFDRSMGHPEGTTNLEGSIHDVQTFWRICLELGMKPRNLRVVTSPRVHIGDLPGATEKNVGKATEKGVRDALGWLVDKTAAGRAGLLTYSGHGAHTKAKGLLLCPSDVSSACFDHAIPFTELRALLKSATNLTVVLGCCHASLGPTDAHGRRVTTMGGDGLNETRCESDLCIGARVLAACKPGEITQQAMFSGLSQGTFTWAIGSIVEQWTAKQDGHNVRLTLSYGELVNRARRLLPVLDFAGTPQIYGDPGVEELAVMQVGSRPDPTNEEPDTKPRILQIDSGSKGYVLYGLTNTTATGAINANLVVANTSYTYTVSSNTSTYAAATEYWGTSAMLASLKSAASGDTLAFNPGGGSTDWPTSGPVSGFSGLYAATMVQPVTSVTWSQMTSPPTNVFCASVSPTGNAAVSFANATYTSATNQWSGTVEWYYLGSSAPTSSLIGSGGASTLTYTATAPTPRAGYNWYSASISVSTTHFY